MKLTIPEAKFANMNVRAEREGEDVGRGACDLTFQIMLGIRQTAELFGNPATATEVLTGLWDENGNAMCLGLEKFKLDRELENVLVDIRPEFNEAVALEECTVGKIELTPSVAGYFEIKLRAQGHPTPEEVGALYELQGRDLELRLTQKQRDMFDGPQGETEDADSEQEQTEEAPA